MSAWHKKALSLKSLVHHSTNFFNGTGFCQHANNSYSRPLHHTDVPEIGAHQFWMHMTVLELMGIWHEIPDWTNLPPLLSPSVPWILWPWVFLSCPKSRQGSVRDWALSHRERALSPWRAVGYWEQQANQLNHWRRAPLGGATFPSNANSHCQLYTSKQFFNVLLWWCSGWLGGWIRWIRCCKYVMRLVILPLPCHDYDGAAVNSMSHNEPLSNWGFWEEKEKS